MTMTRHANTLSWNVVSPFLSVMAVPLLFPSIPQVLPGNDCFPPPKGEKNRHGQNAVPVLPGGGGMDPPVGRIYFFLTAPSLMMSQFLRR